MTAHGAEPLGKALVRGAFLRANSTGYRALRGLMFPRVSAQDAHERLTVMLRRADDQRLLLPLFDLARSIALTEHPVTVGDLALSSPLILAAGLVKGDGFESEAAALDAVARGANIIPGWRSVPRLVGLVEFGSFTRWPRLGNPGTVVWRDVATQSTQNRVGLRNPGVQAAASFFAARHGELPTQFGINIAVSPGVEDAAQQQDEVLAGLAAFTERGVYPAWFTLNLSCPNTEDDPHGNQSAELAQQLAGAAVAYLAESREAAGRDLPLWVKVGPELGEAQYRALLHACEDAGVAAIIATNTRAMPTPDDHSLTAGVGGGKLHAHALAAATVLLEEKFLRASPVAVIGCGGVIDGDTYREFAERGTAAVQYWSALVFRGPLAAALIAAEAGLAR